MYTVWFLELFSNRKQASKEQRKDMKFVENFRTPKSPLGSGQLQRVQEPVPASCSLTDQEEQPACFSLSSPDLGSAGTFVTVRATLWFIVLPGCGAESQGCLTGTSAAPGMSCTPHSFWHFLALVFAVITPLFFHCRLLPNKQSTPNELFPIGPSFAASALRFGLFR